MGGYVTLAWCRKHAKDGRLRGLIFANTRADADATETREARDVNARLVREKGMQPLVAQQLPGMFSSKSPTEAVEFARSVMESQRPEGVAAALEAMRDRPDSTALLPTLDVPALVLCGSGDVISPPDVMRALSDELPQSRYVEIAGAGHLTSLESPEAFDTAIRDFVTLVDSGRPG